MSCFQSLGFNDHFGRESYDDGPTRPPKTDLDRAIKRRAAWALGWLLKTGTMPPVRKQRTRWFVEAQERRHRVEGWTK